MDMMSDILVLVSGTSSCLMASSKKPKFIEGIWGPYYSAMIPDMWLNEAGQSASGKLIDHIIENHPAYKELATSTSTKSDTTTSKHHIYERLNAHLVGPMAAARQLDATTLSTLTTHVHIYPDFHGNRSPLSDPKLTGAVCGLTFDTSLDNLAVLYLASLQSLAYQVKHIIGKNGK